MQKRQLKAARPGAELYPLPRYGTGGRVPPAPTGGPGWRCPQCIRRHICLPQGLAGEEVGRLGGVLSGTRTLARHACLYRAGDSLDCVFLLRSGAIKLMYTASNGDEQVLNFCLPGEILGLEAMGAERCIDSAVAIETATVCELPIAALERMCSEMPRLQHRLHLMFARQIANSHATLTVVGKGNAEAGVASLVLNLAQRFQAQGWSGKELNLCMSRTDIANFLGMAVETVSRVFTRLHRKGVLKVDKRSILILDPDHLRVLAGESTLSAAAAGHEAGPDARERAWLSESGVRGRHTAFQSG